MIPYGRQFIDEDDIQAVVDVLRSDWLTTGPKVEEFERAVADYVGAENAVAVSSGTAALHAAMFAIDIRPGDEVIVPPMTFAATANCILYQGGTPVFADVHADTLLIDPAEVEKKITSKTKAIIGVDYAGQPCDWDELKTIADRHHLKLVDDGCHALGAEYKGRKVGSLADLTVFSFHPVKHITTGEGGMVLTDEPAIYERAKRFRTHGITATRVQRETEGTWYYEMVDLGFNYRITDIQCALGISQMKKLPWFLERRHEIARVYDEAFAASDTIRPLIVKRTNKHAYHLYVIRVEAERRAKIFAGIKAAGIGVNVHYVPVNMHPFYRKSLSTSSGLCPRAEAAYGKIISLPMHPALSEGEIETVIRAVKSEIKRDIL